VGYPEDALEIIQVVSGDDRADGRVRLVLHAVKARAHATLGDTLACYRSVEAVEAGQASLVGQPDPGGWLASLATPARVAAATGHALAELAIQTADGTAAAQASRRLSEAIDAFDATTHARAHALCVAQLAVVQLSFDQVEQGAAWGRLALLATATVRSARLYRAIAQVRRLAAEHLDQAEAKALVEEIDTATGDEPD
jgi:hypothetical protein